MIKFLSGDKCLNPRIYMVKKRFVNSLSSASSPAHGGNQPAGLKDAGARDRFSDGLRFHQAGELKKAMKIYEEILRVQPKHYDALHLLGLLLHQIGNHVAALSLIDKAIAFKPDNAIFHNHKGLVLHALGDYQRALDSFALALHFNSRLALAYTNRGNSFGALNQYEEAIMNYDLAIQIDPRSTHAYFNKASILEKIGESDRAVSVCDALLQLSSENAQAHCVRGMSLLSMGKTNDAIAAFDRALALNPVLPQALCNRGIAYQRTYQYRQGLNDFNRCIELEPNNSTLFFNRGSLLFQSGDVSGALASYDLAIMHDANNAEAYFNKALLYLSKMEFKRGWELYEWRFVNPKEPQAKLKTSLPSWDPNDPTHRRVLIWAEQGVGDQILFGTMLQDAKERIPVITVMLDQRLIPIFSRSMPNITFIPINSPVKEDDFDAHLSMMGLGTIFRNSAHDFSHCSFQYLWADISRAEILRRELVGEGELLCGIFWKSRKNKNELKKSLDLIDLLPILQIPGVKFVNLQYGDAAEDCKEFFEKTGIEITNCHSVDNFNDLDGHAALIQACDFIVGCSNSSAHLAGALGKKTYLALGRGGGTFWYWANQVDERSLWYPSINIYQQVKAGDWVKPVHAICARILEDA